MRKIIHIDMDCFYAAVEIRDDANLRGKPVAVGAKPSARGVICSANYEARGFGVRSAMSSAQALKHCKELILLPVNMAKYKAVSEGIHAIFSRYTDKIEPLSLDEAYLDVTQSTLYRGSATAIAEAIRADIEKEQKVTASAGVSINKFLAKVASGWNKPNGLCVIAPHQVSEFVGQLPVEAIWGVGAKTAAKLHVLGIKTCLDIQKLAMPALIKHFGSFGADLYYLSRGVDELLVEPDRESKSVSAEITFNQDLPDLEACIAMVPEVLARLNHRLARNKGRVIKKQFVKIKFHDFSATTLEQKSNGVDAALYVEQLKKAYGRRNKPVRLIGFGVDFAEPSPQLNLF